MKRKIELHLCLPNYGGMIHAPFERSLLACQQNGPPRFSRIIYIDGDSLIGRARNNCAEQFLAGPHTHLVFIDTDIEFAPEDVDKLVTHLQAGHMIVTGMYPKKQDKLEWVLNCCKENPDLPKTGEDPLMEIKYAGTGFMAIDRAVFMDIMAGSGKNNWYWTDGGQGGRRVQFDFFPTGVCEYPDGDRRYLSEDWYFCELARRMGHKIMCDTSIRTKHIGKKVYHEGM